MVIICAYCKNNGWETANFWQKGSLGLLLRNRLSWRTVLLVIQFVTSLTVFALLFVGPLRAPSRNVVLFYDNPPQYFLHNFTAFKQEIRFIKGAKACMQVCETLVTHKWRKVHFHFFLSFQIFFLFFFNDIFHSTYMSRTKKVKEKKKKTFSLKTRYFSPFILKGAHFFGAYILFLEVLMTRAC